jgi:hypothetical protein
MNIIAFIFILVAVVLFLVAALRTRPWSIGYLGLAALAAGLIFEFASKSHTLSF